MRVGSLLGVSAMLLLRAAPLATTACQCQERGTFVEIDPELARRTARFFASGEACEAKDVVCQHRDAADHCDTYWIEPPREGTCTFGLELDDGRRVETTILFDEDDEYPCRGNVRPLHDQRTRLSFE